MAEGIGIMFGNLTVNALEKRLGIELSEDHKEYLESTRQDGASNVLGEKWHCFDIPFRILAGDSDTGDKIVAILSQYDIQCEEQLGVTW